MLSRVLEFSTGGAEKHTFSLALRDARNVELL